MISNNGVYCSLQRTAQTGSNQGRKRSGRLWCTTEQEDNQVSSRENRSVTGPQLAASLNGTSKTPISTSTVNWRLQVAGLVGRVVKKNSYLRLANRRKRLRWATDIGQRMIGEKCYGQTNLRLRCLEHKEHHL